MKKITITLSKKAEKVFNEIMYSLPKEQDGSEMCKQSKAINYALESIGELETIVETDILYFIDDLKKVNAGIDIIKKIFK
jgi:hypothetical protein